MSSYTIVDQVADIRPALAKLRQRRGATLPFLAVDCEAESLGRSGELSLVSVASESDTFLFDIKALGAQVFDRGLRDLLEDSSVEKLMFDCRGDSDCLWHQFKVKLANVLDLQLLQVIYNETHPKPVTRSSESGSQQREIRNFQPRVLGFLTCLELYVGDETELIRAKADGSQRVHEKGVWLKRPLDDTMLAYAAADVQGFFLLYSALKQGIEGRDAWSRVRKASQRYVDHFRLLAVRTNDEYERNPYLPWRVLPEAGTSGAYREEVKCTGCQRRFPRSDFIPAHLRKGKQSCPVCRKVFGEIHFPKPAERQVDG